VEALTAEGWRRGAAGSGHRLALELAQGDNRAVPGLALMQKLARATMLTLWAFQAWAQFGAEPADDGWVAIATLQACEAARFSYLQTARIHGGQVKLGECHEMTAEEFRALTPDEHRALPSTN
jgi:hypothetical protein